MKSFIFAIVAVLGLASMAEANGPGQFRSRSRAAVRIVAPQQFYGGAQFRSYGASFQYAQPARIIYQQPFSLGFGSGCGAGQFNQFNGCGDGQFNYGGGQFRSRAFLGMGFGY